MTGGRIVPLRTGAACLLAAIICLGAAPSRAEEPVADEWQFTVTSYVWATSLNGDVEVKGNQVDVDSSFIDILKNSDSLIGLEGRLAAQKGNWGVYLDGIYNRIGASGSDDRRFISLDADATLNLAIAELAIFYEVGRWDLPVGSIDGESQPQIMLQPYAGARYTYLDIDLDVDIKALGQQRHAQFDGDKHWVDPIVGGRVFVDITKRWQVVLGADVGGFGVGTDLTWSALGLLGYGFEMFGLQSQAVAGYRALYQDYEDGNGSDEFKWDMTLHGPIVGFVARF